jgi:hypothetical protein
MLTCSLKDQHLHDNHHDNHHPRLHRARCSAEGVLRIPDLLVEKRLKCHPTWSQGHLSQRSSRMVRMSLALEPGSWLSACSMTVELPTKWTGFARVDTMRSGRSQSHIAIDPRWVARNASRRWTRYVTQGLPVSFHAGPAVAHAPML